jgi:intracellular septation protein A
MTNPPLPQFGSLYRSLAITVVLPLGIVLALQNFFHVPAIQALAIGAIIPLAVILVGWVREHRLEPLSFLMLIVIAGGIAASIVSGDVRFALIKESFATIIVGATFLGSLLAPRPLIFWLGQQFSTGNDAAKKAAWETRWQTRPAFRHGIRVMTLVWGLGFLLDAVARVVFAFTLPANAVIVLSPISVIVITVGLVLWTLRYSRAALARAAKA